MKSDADIIAAMVGGLEGPVTFLGSTFFRLRISGTGCAFRQKQGEFCFRDPRLWLTDSMAMRWAGVPLIVLHPPGGLLDAAAFYDRVIGTIVRAFVDGDELIGVARILDADVAMLLAKYGADTSPSVRFGEGEVEPITLKTGERFLVERDPILCDHLAICPEGVWSKGDHAEKGVQGELT
jgi:hypothetical protein